VMVTATERDPRRDLHVKLHWLDTLASVLSRADGSPPRP